VTNKRYQTEGAWIQVKGVSVFPYRGGDAFGRVVTYTADLLDTKTGHIYYNGSYRVSVLGPAGRPRGRTFKGETAWSDAERYAIDAVHTLERMMREVYV